MCNQRTCVTCGLSKDLTAENFYPSKYHEGGYNTQCRKCNIARVLEQEKILREQATGFNPNSNEEQKRKAQAAEFYRKREIDERLKQGTHRCGSCGLDLSLDSFDRNKDSYSGLQSICKQCKRSSKEDKAKG